MRSTAQARTGQARAFEFPIRRMKRWFSIVGAVALTFVFVAFDAVRVHGDSMRPTLCDTDIAITAKPWLVPRSRLVSQVVVYDSADGKLNVKRVVGVAGDKVRIERGRVVRNDVLAREDYLCESDANLFVSWPEQNLPGVRASFSIQTGVVLAVGDNRPISVDSRARGVVEESRLRGIVALTLPRFLQQAPVCKCN